jgi:hypothetical protein
VLADLLSCDEYSFVRRAYWVLLGREPDPAGLANYLNQLRAGTSKSEVLSEMAGSPEGRIKGGAMPIDMNEVPAPPVPLPIIAKTESWDQLLAYHGGAFVACAYQTLLGRNADPTGQRNYLAKLRDGISKVQLLAFLRHSEEFKSRARGQKTSPLVRRLDREVTKFYLARIPLVGWIFKAVLGIEGNSPMEMRLRRIEYLLMSSSREYEVSPEIRGADALPLSSEPEEQPASPGSAMRSLARGIADPSLQTAAANVATLRSLPMPTNWKKETEHG